MKLTGSLLENAGILLLMLLLSVVCFYDVLWLNFFSDDFHVMHRLTIDNIFWAPGFFRPLSDATLLFSYYTFGYDAFGYRLFNVLLHGINGFIFYKTLQNVLEVKEQQKAVVAFVASLFFITYPFHTESIIWIVGRASLVANTFGILSLYFFFSKMKYKLRIFLSCLCYFIGLASYESILVIPGMIFFAGWYYRSLRAAFVAIIPYAATLVVHLVVRLSVAGVFAGNYGKDMFGENQTNYAAKFFKSFGRLFVPPIQSTTLLFIAFAAAFTLVAATFYVVYQNRRKHFHFYLLLWLFLLVAHIVPTMFGIDTHTSDGDRLLYFPSYFLAGIIAFFLCLFSRSTRSFFAVSAALVAVGVLLIKHNNRNWIKADVAISEILTAIKEQNGKPHYFINMPDAVKGSFIFRNGLYEALEIKRIQHKVKVINYLRHEQTVAMPANTEMETVSDLGMHIAPVVTIKGDAFLVDVMVDGKELTKEVKRDPSAAVLYWNRNKVVSLLP